MHTCIGPRFAHLSWKGATELVSCPAPAPVLLEILDCMVTRMLQLASCAQEGASSLLLTVCPAGQTFITLAKDASSA